MNKQINQQIMDEYIYIYIYVYIYIYIHVARCKWSVACFRPIEICIQEKHIHTHILVGGLDQFLFFHILGIIIPTDFHIFQRDWNHQSVSMWDIPRCSPEASPAVALKHVNAPPALRAGGSKGKLQHFVVRLRHFAVSQRIMDSEETTTGQYHICFV